MGGGDLNMKKGHHPATMKNLEKKWLAEQKRDSEKKQIEQLQRELEEERAREDVKRQAVEAGLKKKSDRVDWMYQHMAIDREQYLLGKPVDKQVDPTYNAEQERRAADAPGALFTGDAIDVSNDVATKIREDPLFHIRKKENEHKKALLNNPIKMKQIQQMLREGLSGKKDKKKKKSKKKHRDVKDDERMPKEGVLLRGRSRSPLKPRRQWRSPPSGKVYKERCRDWYHSPSRNGHHNRQRSRSHSPVQHKRDSKRKRSPSPTRDIQNYEKRRCRSPHSDGRDYPQRSRHDRQSNRSKVSSRDRYNDTTHTSRSRVSCEEVSDRERSQSRSIYKERQKRSQSPRRDRQNSKHESVSLHHVQDDSHNDRGKTHDVTRNRSKFPEKKKLDKETIEKKRLEMMENAKKRDKEREARVRQYREEAAKEEDMQQQTAEKLEDSAFLHSMKVTSYSSNQSSVEDRIKRNINSLQRTNASLDKHFLKK